MVEKGFSCSNLTGYPEPPSTCAFGSSGYEPKKSKTYLPYPDHNFNIGYEDGEFLTGTVGFETINVGGLVVPKQEFGVVNAAAWEGDGINSGLIGLCFPNITSVYTGTDPDADSNANNEPYNPFFFNAVKDKLVSKSCEYMSTELPRPSESVHMYVEHVSIDFSVALNRGTFAAQESSTYDPNLGYLAFGGLAPVPTTSPSVTVPLQGLATESSGTGYFFYIVRVFRPLLAVVYFVSPLRLLRLGSRPPSTSTHSLVQTSWSLLATQQSSTRALP